MFNKVTNNIYVGTFKDVPSRSGEACITLVITSTFDEECFMSYEHHEDTDNFLGTKSQLIAHLQESISNQADPDWKEGCKVLCMAVEDILAKA